jgi:hypothetical protein
MATAAEFQQVGADLYFWQAYEPAVKCDLSSCALEVGGRLIFVDPILLAKAALADLAAVASPALIVLTNGNHARAAAEYRERFQVPIAAPADAVPELGLTPDQLLADDEHLLDALTVIALPGAGPGEIALQTASGIVCIGDALINLEPDGLALLPDKYCIDAKLLRTSLRKRLPREARVLTFAHGVPLVTAVRTRLDHLFA